MSKPKVLVTGATGKTGMPTVQELCNYGWPVRAVVHKEDARSAKLRQMGAEVVVANLYDYAQMAKAMKDIRRASFLPPVQPYMIQAASVFAVAAQEAGIEHVTQLSQWLPHPSHPSLHTRQLWLTEQVLSMIPGTTFTLINPGIFADPILQMLPSAVNLGVLPNLFNGLRTPSPSNEDIGRCIAAGLMYPEKHAGKRYRPTSPQALDMNEMAELIGHAAEDFETIVRRYAAMPFAQPTLANKMKAITDFLRILITPPLDTKRHDAAMEYPMPPNPVLAGNSAIWRQQHAANSGIFSFAAQPKPSGNSQTVFQGARP